MKDCLIVGAGPAGLAVANTLQKGGVDVLVVERGAIASHITQYPTFMRWFSTRELLEIDGYPMTIVDEKPTRQEYLNYLARFTRDRRIPVRTFTSVEQIERTDSASFRVTIRPQGREAEVVEARHVVVACGAWEYPRKLDVPGEDLPKVTWRFRESHEYFGRKVLVVGGRNSAVETALILWRSGVDVSLSYRRTTFDGLGLKYWLRPDIENRIRNGEIHGYLGSHVERIDWDTVTLRDQDGRRFEIENDAVILQLGYDPPVGFLKGLGIKVEEGSNIPVHDPETLETNVPGLYIAGTITAGNVSGKVFIENSRHHGELILNGIRASAKIGV